MNEKIKRIALSGIMCALGIAISFTESLIPPIVSIPGAKPGFSNIVIMYAMGSLGFPYALAITVFKALFALITRGLTAFFMSLCGGLFSLLIMLLLFRIKSNKIGYIGIGVLCAVFHNLGQLTVAVVILGKTILAIAPWLLISGVICGMVTGTVFGLTYPVLLPRTKFISNHFSSKC